MENDKKTSKLVSRFKSLPKKVRNILVLVFAFVIVVGIYFIYSTTRYIYSDKAEIYAPLIILSPSQPNILEKVMVKEGDKVSINQAVAQIDGGEFIHAKVDGVVVNTNNEVGKIFAPGTPVVSMINPDDLRLVVHVAENKGLDSVAVGQKVMFKVDAFGSKKFYGVVESVSQISDQSSVVFSISDKRDEKYFSIKVKFGDYPKLLNGMSAKAWIYK